MNASAIGLDKSELLFWTILRNFEALALKQYELNVPSLASPEKKELVALLNSQASSDEALEGTSLALPVKNLIASATASDESHTLIIQGLLLEILGQVIYQMFGKDVVVSPATSELCIVGLKANKVTREKIPQLIAQKIGNGEQLLQALTTASREVLKQLNALGEGLDENFDKRFGIAFADVMGEFASELIPACTELGVERRKLVSYLTAALMGI